MHALASRYCTQCYHQQWSHKTGGWVGIDMLVRKANLGSIWVREHQLEIIRALLFMLKDMPGDPPGNSEDVGNTLVHVLEVANARPNTEEGDADAMEVEASTEAAAPTTSDEAASKAPDAAQVKETIADGDADEKDESETNSKSPDKGDQQTKDGDGDVDMADGKQATAKPAASGTTQPNGAPPKKPLTPEEQERILVERQFSFLVGILVQELSSANELVRKVTQRSFKLLARVRGCSPTEVLSPVKDRLLGPIFSKPLRALPFGMQIGHIDAVTFCLQLDPPLPEFNEELFRVLTEALALADADDAALIGRTSQYKNMVSVTNLRVASIKLLSAAMACNDFLGQKQAQMRMKIISVYFKSLYSRSAAVVEIAHASLKSILQSQAKVSTAAFIRRPAADSLTLAAATERRPSKRLEANSHDPCRSIASHNRGPRRSSSSTRAAYVVLQS
jgi:hypothetical protein